VPEIIDPVFTKTSPIRSFCMSENERFGLVFVKTGSKNSGTGLDLFSIFDDFLSQLHTDTRFHNRGWESPNYYLEPAPMFGNGFLLGRFLRFLKKSLMFVWRLLGHNISFLTANSHRTCNRNPR
jgi:hypothetical protein